MGFTLGANDDRGLDGPDESATSFGSIGLPTKTVKHTWTQGNDRVNHDTYHRMVEEYRTAKKREKDLELKAKQLAAQLARTEEAAKRALVQTDASARGGAAQKLLDAERCMQKLRSENAELASKLAREKKRSQDFKNIADTHKARIDCLLREQRQMVKRIGELERQAAGFRRKPEDDYWGEEAGRRFVQQQDELVATKEEVSRLKHLLESDGPVAQAKAYEAQINELQNLVKFYERKITALADAGVIGPDGVPVGALRPDQEGPTGDDWILEEFYHNDELYLLDRKTGKLFTVPGDNTYPRPLGIRTNKEVKMGNFNVMERLLATLDGYLSGNGAKLQEVFNQFDLDNSGQLDRRELQRLLQTLMPDLEARAIEELRTMLDVDGDGNITFPEMLQSIKETFEARTASKVGRHIEVNEVLDRIRDAIREDGKLMREAFDELDTDHDGCLTHLEVISLIRRFLRDMHQKEVRYLLGKLQLWDVLGEGKITFEELLCCLELKRVFRVGQGIATAMRSSSPMRGRGQSPGRAGPGGGGNVRDSVAAFKASVRSTVGGGGLKEAFMRERLAQLEAELKGAQARNGELEEDSRKVELLIRDVALYKARIEDLEKDFMKIDLLGAMEAAGPDEQLQKAWEVASTFKKRFMEHKGELDNIRIMYARMQGQLDETHKLLHEEHRKRFKLEDEVTRLQTELMRISDLEQRLTHEKGERVKLEREYLLLQQKALNTPGEALAEVRSLREELFAAKREKAQAQQKENEVRMELAHVRELLDGMSQDKYRSMQDDDVKLRQRVASLTLELQAMRDKLAVYQRTTDTTVGDGMDDDDLLFGSSKKPDADKTREELIHELVQLRDVWRLDQGEIKKLHKVLETESAITLEAKAALEEAHREMERLKRELQNDLKKLEREIERRDEKIRKLELQLRGAYSGINRALRSSKGHGLRDSLRSSDGLDNFSEIGEDQNIFELHITEAQVYEEVLGKDPSTFFTFDFFMHESQATPVVASNTPSYNTVIQYVVDQDPFLLEYMDNHCLDLEMCRARGYDYDVIGVAHLPLRQVLEDLEIGAALGYNRAYHYADVFGADGKRIARVRYGYCFRRPLDGLIKDYKLQARTKRASDPDERDPATAAVHQAHSQAGGSSSAIKLIIDRCEQLVPMGASPISTKPYVHYKFPGYRDYHETKTLAGINPVYNDEMVWPIARTPELEADLKTRQLQIVVFDDATSDDPLRAIIGVALVPMGSLAQGIPVEGAFKLTNPVTKKPAGRLVLGMGWHNPLQPPGAPPKAPAPRVPISSALVDAPAPDLGGFAGFAGTFPGDEAFAPRGSTRAAGPQAGMHGLAMELAGAAAAGAGLPSQQGAMNAGVGAGMGMAMGGGMPSRPGSVAGASRAGRDDGYGLSAEAGARQQQLQQQQYQQQPGGYGMAAEVGGRNVVQQQQQAPYGQQPVPYGQAMPHGQQQQALYGRQQQQPFGQQQQQPYGQQQQPPYSRQQQQSPYGQQQMPQPGFGLTAEVSGRQPQQQMPYGQQQQQAGYMQQQGPGQGPQQSSEYGLGSELPPGPPQPYGMQAPQQMPGMAPLGRGPYGMQAQQAAGPGSLGAPQRVHSRPPSRGASGDGFGLMAEQQPTRPPAGMMSPPPQQHPGGRFRRDSGMSEGVGLDAELRQGSATSQRPPVGGARPPIPQPLGRQPPGSPPLGEEGFGLGAEMEDDTTPREMMLAGRTSGRARYAEFDQSVDSAPPPSMALPPAALAAAAAGPVLVREQPDPATWKGLEFKVILVLHSLELTPEAQRSPRLKNLVLMHTLLSGGVSELDTCTQPVVARAGPMPIEYAVSYNVLASGAGADLLASLGSGDDYGVEVKLMSTSAQRLDMNSLATPGTLQSVGFCMLPLSDIWAGRRRDVLQEQYEIVEDNDDMTHVATVVVSLVAEAAMRTLRQQQQQGMGRR